MPILIKNGRLKIMFREKKSISGWYMFMDLDTYCRILQILSVLYITELLKEHFAPLEENV